MLSVIIDARAGADRLPALLAQLTAGAVDGLVRQVLIVAAPGEAGIDLLCEDMGAEARASFQAAAEAARSEHLLVLPADFRLRDGWMGSLQDHMARGGEPALVAGLGEPGLFARRPFGVLVERSRLHAARHGADLQGLRRSLGLGRRRIG